MGMPGRLKAVVIHDTWIIEQCTRVSSLVFCLTSVFVRYDASNSTLYRISGKCSSTRNKTKLLPSAAHTDLRQCYLGTPIFDRYDQLSSTHGKLRLRG